jgi:dTDP-L-rhamnose 4-epimerase
LDFVILRLQNVYGPGQQIKNPYAGILGVFAGAVLRDEVVELFEDGQMTRDFIHVADVAEGFRRAISHQGSLSGVFNLGSGQAMTLQDLVGRIAEASGRPGRSQVSGRFRHGDIRHASADMARFESVLGVLPLRSLSEGLRQYLVWFRGQEAPPSGLAKGVLDEMTRQGTLRRQRD